MNHLIEIWKQPKVFILLLILIFLAACSEASEEEAVEELVPPDHLHDTAWLVTAYENSEGELVDVLDGTEITTSFSQEKVDGGTVYGFTGCNDYYGDYNVSGEANVWAGIDLVLTTQNTCTEPVGIMEQEKEFISALAFSRKWQIDGLEMIFTKTGYDAETEAEQDVTLLSFDYTGEAVEFSREEEFIVPEDGLEFTYTFEDDEEGWITGFADLPADYDPAIYELDSEWQEMPDDLDGYGIYMQGHNRSDDLFMFLKREVDGLEPGATYRATFRLVLASNVPPGLSGIGGSPGESVYVKVGATTEEPLVEEDPTDGWLRMNIDKGNQATEGEDMINIGDMANPNLTPDSAGSYELMEQNSGGREFEVMADQDGVLWFIVGTDSGFEGLTTLYYDTITVVLEQQ
jgi:heat shock protein HslJ